MRICAVVGLVLTPAAAVLLVDVRAETGKQLGVRAVLRLLGDDSLHTNCVSYVLTADIQADVSYRDELLEAGKRALQIRHRNTRIKALFCCQHCFLPRGWGDFLQC